MDQLAAMRAFTRIVETGSFTRASGSLGVPRATLTKLIQSLEEHLHTLLLNRSTRRVAITPDGAAYYERATRLIGEIDELDGSLAGAQLRPSGRLRIDVAVTLARDIILPALPDFFARYPGIQLDIGASDRPADMVAENVDCVVRGGTIADPGLIARRIAAVDLVTCAAPSYLARRGTPAQPRDLEQGHEAAGYFNAGSGVFYPFRFERDGETLDIAVRHKVAANEVSCMVAAGVAGLGIAQAPLFLVRPMLADGRLVRVLDGWRAPSIPLYVVYPPNRHLSNKLRVFVEWIARLLAEARLEAGAAAL